MRRDDTSEYGLLATPLGDDCVRKADVLLHNGRKRSNGHAFMMGIRMDELMNDERKDVRMQEEGGRSEG